MTPLRVRVPRSPRVPHGVYVEGMSSPKKYVTDPRRALARSEAARDTVSYVMHPLIQAQLREQDVNLRYVTVGRVRDGIVTEVTIHNHPVR